MNLTDTEKKVIMLAMDRSAQIGEVANAAVKLIELLRKRYFSGHELLKDLESIQRTEIKYIDRIKVVERIMWRDRVQFKQRPFAEYKLMFGKHKGKKLEEIPVDYLLWVLDNFDDLNTHQREAIETFLDTNGKH